MSIANLRKDPEKGMTAKLIYLRPDKESRERSTPHKAELVELIRRWNELEEYLRILEHTRGLTPTELLALVRLLRSSIHWLESLEEYFLLSLREQEIS